MKTTYKKPVIRVVKIQQMQLICTSIESNVGLQFKGGSAGPARSRRYEDWDEE